MTQVTVGENEGIESALRRFKRQVSKSGIFADLKRLRHHETPIEKYKKKATTKKEKQEEDKNKLSCKLYLIKDFNLNRYNLRSL